MTQKRLRTLVLITRTVKGICYLGSQLNHLITAVRNHANRALGFIFRSVSNESAEVTVRLNIALNIPHLDYVAHWCPYFRKDIDPLECL